MFIVIYLIGCLLALWLHLRLLILVAKDEAYQRDWKDSIGIEDIFVGLILSLLSFVYIILLGIIVIGLYPQYFTSGEHIKNKVLNLADKIIPTQGDLNGKRR